MPLSRAYAGETARVTAASARTVRENMLAVVLQAEVERRVPVCSRAENGRQIHVRGKAGDEVSVTWQCVVSLWQ